jgi:uncharacterized membrane protein
LKKTDQQRGGGLGAGLGRGQRWVGAAAVSLAAATALGADNDALLETAGRMHPALVHFPIALILTALIFETVRIVIRHNRPSPAAIGCLLIATISAAVAAGSGWVHADAEGLAGDSPVELHRWVAIASGSLALLALIFAIAARSGGGDDGDDRHVARRLYVLFLVLAAGTVGFAGHQGGELVYGKGYMFEPIFGKADGGDADEVAFIPPTGSVPAVIDFERDLLPTFEARCIKCHGPKKQNGKLRLDSLEELLASKYFDEIVVAGDPDASTMFERINLPQRDRDFMPKRGDRLSEWEIKAIHRWITGLEPSVDAAGRAGDDDVLGDLEALLGQDDSVTEALVAVIDAVTERGGYAGFESRGSRRLIVNWSVLPRPMTADDFAVLEPASDSIVELNLGGVGVTDSLLEPVAGFAGLERLNISRSDISDGGLATLGSLERLRVLNLYGSPVSNASVETIAALPGLERVYLWRTFINETGIEALREAKPGLEIIADIEQAEPEPEQAEPEDADEPAADEETGGG